MGNSKIIIDEVEQIDQSSFMDEELSDNLRSRYECYYDIVACLAARLKVMTAEALKEDNAELTITLAEKTDIKYVDRKQQSKWSATTSMDDEEEEEDEDDGFIIGSDLDLEGISEYEMANARVQMRKIAQQLVNAISRHRKRSRKQEDIDFRRTMRASVQTGGIMMDLKYRNKIMKKPRLIFILDTSGSMQPWSSMLIQLVQAIGLELTKKEVFIFSSEIEAVTKDIQRTWEETAEVLRQKNNWGGTTSLENSLYSFRENYKSYLSTQSIVLILSDLCTENPAKAAREVSILKHKVRAVYLFHAATEDEDYEKYVVPFKGRSSGLYDIYSLDDMAEAVKNVVIR